MTSIFKAAMNNVITKVKKYEVRQEGVSSKARRALEWEVFYSLLVLACHLYGTVDMGLVLTTVLCLEWQITGRIDDEMKRAVFFHHSSGLRDALFKGEVQWRLALAMQAYNLAAMFLRTQ